VLVYLRDVVGAFAGLRFAFVFSDGGKSLIVPARTSSGKNNRCAKEHHHP
jgi:hypothetical protein